MSDKARALVQNAKTVASPPMIYERLVRVINNPRSGSADVARVIGEDPGLTARLLKIVNSAFFSFPRRIETVTSAVTVVGTSQIRDLALATSVMTLFRDVPRDLIDMDQYWRHCLGTGVMARVIAAQRREDNIERFFVSGLLHDIGRLIMFMHAGNEISDAIEFARESGRPLHRVERERMGYDHAQVGAALMESWNFPGTFAEAVAYHHKPRRASRYPIEAAAVHLADIVMNALHWGSSGEPRTPELDEKVFDILGVDPASIPGLLRDVERQVDAAVELLSAAAGAAA